MDDHAEDCAGDEQQAAADAVDVGKDYASCGEENYVLDDGGVEGCVAALYKLAYILKVGWV